MKSFKWLGLLAVVTCSFVIGCGGSAGPTPVADQDDLAAYVAENPDSDEGLEPVGDDAADQ
jgi:hypothetical protein